MNPSTHRMMTARIGASVIASQGTRKCAGQLSSTCKRGSHSLCSGQRHVPHCGRALCECPCHTRKADA